MSGILGVLLVLTSGTADVTSTLGNRFKAQGVDAISVGSIAPGTQLRKHETRNSEFPSKKDGIMEPTLQLTQWHRSIL